MRRMGLIGAACLLVVASCGDGSSAQSSAPTGTSVQGSTRSSAAATTADNTTTTTTNLPTRGEPIEFGPRAGDRLAVIGVRFDDVLNVRSSPGVEHAVLLELIPLEDDIVATGNSWQVPGAIWVELEHAGSVGWANLTYLAYLGASSDATAQVLEALDEVPVTSSIAELGAMVAQSQASVDPQSEIVMVAAPTSGDLAEVTFDVVGGGDDAVRGLRLHVFASSTPTGFMLKSVEMTTLCGRGVTSEGLCP